MCYKKITSILFFALCLCGVLFGQPYIINGLTYEFTSPAQNEVMVSKGTDLDGQIEIPDNVQIPSFGNRPVVKIKENGFASYENLSLVRMHEGYGNNLREIGDNAFRGCISLTGTTLPNNVSYIGDYAFKDCTNFRNIKISPNLQYIGIGAFEGTDLQRLYFSDPQPALGNVFLPSTLTEIAAEAFKGCGNITNINLLEGLLTIGDYAFSFCTGLSTITIPSSVTYIGKNPFLGCSENLVITFAPGNTHYAMVGHCLISTDRDGTLIKGYADSEIPQSVTRLGSCSFAYLPSLTNFTISENITSMDDNPFVGCDPVITIPPDHPSFSMVGNCLIEGNKVVKGRSDSVIPDFVTEIGGHAFADTDLTNIDLSSLQRIGRYAFANTGIGSVILPPEIEEIDAGAFSDCISLETVTIPNRYRDDDIYRDVVLGERIFAGCTALTYVRLPDTFPTITAEMFSGCTSLETVVIPGNAQRAVVRIDDRAFEDCSDLPTVVIPLSVVTMGSYVFVGCNSLNPIYVEAPSKPAGWADDWNPDPRPVTWNYLTDYDEVTPKPSTKLVGNYPNPFNPATTISFVMEKDEQVTLDIYNLKGQKVKEVVNGSYSAGKYNVVWKGDDTDGRSVGSGIYFYRMTSGEYSSVKKMILLK